MLDAFLQITLVVLAVGGVACAGYWLVILWHVAINRLSLPTARRGMTLPPVDKSVCVIIPAHNEAGVIEGLVASLRAQDHKKMQAVLALDRCTDNTAELARAAIGDDSRIRVLEIESCPDGWAGKVNAVWTAVQTSPEAQSADLLLFADADTEFHPACVRATSAVMEHLDRDFLSLLSTLTTDTWFEWVAQPAAGLELTRQYPLVRASRDERRRPFANGQFMLFRAETYRAIGGHELVKDQLLEDLALARKVHGVGARAAVLFADGMLRCRMYDTWPQFRKGWKRIFTECANQKDSRLDRSASRLVLTSTLMPVLSVGAVAVGAVAAGPIAGIAFVLGMVGLGSWLVAHIAMHAAARSPIWPALVQPIGAMLVAAILRDAARDLRSDTPTEWGGKKYHRPRRGAEVAAGE
ncbi:MAG: glycosyltransferase [Planctomycetota bacterium]